MQKKWFKKFSLLLLGLFLFVDANMIEKISYYFSISDLATSDVHNTRHKEEPTEQNSIEKVIEKAEFIVEDFYSIINPSVFIISNVYSSKCFDFWLNRSITVFVPPPNYL